MAAGPFFSSKYIYIYKYVARILLLSGNNHAILRSSPGQSISAKDWRENVEVRDFDMPFLAGDSGHFGCENV